MDHAFMAESFFGAVVKYRDDHFTLTNSCHRLPNPPISCVDDAFLFEKTYLDRYMYISEVESFVAMGRQQSHGMINGIGVRLRAYDQPTNVHTTIPSRKGFRLELEVQETTCVVHRIILLLNDRFPNPANHPTPL